MTYVGLPSTARATEHHTKPGIPSEIFEKAQIISRKAVNVVKQSALHGAPADVT